MDSKGKKTYIGKVPSKKAILTIVIIDIIIAVGNSYFVVISTDIGKLDMVSLIIITICIIDLLIYPMVYRIIEKRWIRKKSKE